MNNIEDRIKKAIVEKNKNRLKKQEEATIITGEEMYGSKISAIDLQVAQVLGKDVDSIDIPGDKPEERHTNKIKVNSSERER